MGDDLVQATTSKKVSFLLGLGQIHLVVMVVVLLYVLFLGDF